MWAACCSGVRVAEQWNSCGFPSQRRSAVTTSLLPALGYLSEAEDGGITVAPGTSATLSFGAQSLTSTTQQIDWTATASPASGLEIGGSTGTLTLPTEAKAMQSVDIQVPASSAPGEYLVTVALRTASGTALPALVTQVDVT